MPATRTPGRTRSTGPMLALLLATLVAACGGDTPTTSLPEPPTARPPVASVRLSHDALALVVGDAATLRAEALDGNGAPLAGRTVTWRTSDASVAAVDASGAVAAVGAGVANVTAEAEGRSARATVRVAPAGIAALAGRWRIVHVEGRPLPTVVRTMRDVIVDSTRLVALVEIRIDSARRDVLPDGRYQQRFCFTELHDGAIRHRECWGDHGHVALAHVPSQSVTRVRFDSEYLDGLVAEGELTTYGRLHMLDPLWHGERVEVTAWVRE